MCIRDRPSSERIWICAQNQLFSYCIKEGNAVGITVRHNMVHNAPHAAFIYGGNNNILEYNDVFDIARVTGDVGAFYSRWDWTSRCV